MHAHTDTDVADVRVGTGTRDAPSFVMAFNVLGRLNVMVAIPSAISILTPGCMVSSKFRKLPGASLVNNESSTRTVGSVVQRPRQRGWEGVAARAMHTRHSDGFCRCLCCRTCNFAGAVRMNIVTKFSGRHANARNALAPRPPKVLVHHRALGDVWEATSLDRHRHYAIVLAVL